MRRLSTRSGGSPGTSPGQALDPAGGGSDYVPEGNDYKGGAGAEATFGHLAFYTILGALAP